VYKGENFAMASRLKGASDLIILNNPFLHLGAQASVSFVKRVLYYKSEQDKSKARLTFIVN
jgi:hypothetical protein